MNRWDAFFFAVSDTCANMSKDESTRLGAVVVGPDREIRATGFNSFPRGVVDTDPGRQVRPIKYYFIEHAERNAIYNAARVGVSLKGCVLYCQWEPCADCARAIIQAGISSVVVRERCPERWGESVTLGGLMLAEAGVAVRFMGEEQ